MDQSLRTQARGVHAWEEALHSEQAPTNLQDTHVRIHWHVTSCVAEGAAACVLLGMVHPEEQLTILTDSANVMFAPQHCKRQEKWKDFSNHTDKEMIEELALLTARLTAPTTWVKIKSHTSVDRKHNAVTVEKETKEA